jgi:hypothetical protein
MTEKEIIEIQIAHLQGQIKEKRKKLEELEKKSPVEEAFKDNYGVYPNELKTTDDLNCWKSFKRGYNAAYEEKVSEEPEENEWKSVALRFGEELVSERTYRY